MFCITLKSTDPFFNLAIEEVLFKNSTEEYLILGINSPSLIIGKHQSAHREINTRFITENKIPVIRRISGGGAVFHDMGNLNFSFIRQSEPGRQVDFRKYTQPVIDFLISLDVEARFEGKNDLKVNGLKISGNAEHVQHNRVLHHGTLLYSTFLDQLRNSLRKDTSCYMTRAVESNPSSVTNLNRKIKGFKDIYEFRSAMMDYFMKYFHTTDIYEIPAHLTRDAMSLADSKYRSWEWNWAYGPEYVFVKEFGFSGKQIFCRLSVKDGIIHDCLIEGSSKLSSTSGKLIGARHMVDDLREVFRKEDIDISEEEIFNFF